MSLLAVHHRFLSWIGLLHDGPPTCGPASVIIITLVGHMQEALLRRAGQQQHGGTHLHDVNPFLPSPTGWQAPARSRYPQALKCLGSALPRATWRLPLSRATVKAQAGNREAAERAGTASMVQAHPRIRAYAHARTRTWKQHVIASHVVCATAPTADSLGLGASQRPRIRHTIKLPASRP